MYKTSFLCTKPVFYVQNQFLMYKTSFLRIIKSGTFDLQTMNSVRSNTLSLKCKRFTPLGNKAKLLLKRIKYD